MSKKVIYARWLFEDVHHAVKALRQLADSTVIQQGVGSADYEGWDLFEGVTKICSKHGFGDNVSRVYTEVTFAVFETHCVNNEHGYWMTPYCFEGIKTFDEDGKNLYGEAYCFDSTKPEKEFEL